jgi:predicted nucleic acid-binding protein
VSDTLTIDSNIWAYYFDKDSPEHKHVDGPVEEALRSEQLATNTILIMEVAHFLIKNLGPVEGGEKVGVFLSFPFVVFDLDYRGALDSIEMLKRYSHLGIGGRDATVLALMSKEKMKRIMTHDEALKRIDWLEVVDPVIMPLR